MPTLSDAARRLPADHLYQAFDCADAQLMPLGDVCTIVMGQSPEGASYNTEGIGEPLLNGPTEFGPIHPTPAQWTTAPTKFAQPGDILLCVRGATTGRKNLSDRRYCIGRGLAAIRGKGDLTDTDYISHLLNFSVDELLKQASGSTFPNLPGDKLAAILVPIPALPVQKGIAARLTAQMSALAEARAAATAQLAAARQLPAAYLREAFEALPVNHCFSDACDGNGQYGTSQSAGNETAGIPVLGMSNIRNGEIDFRNYKRIILPETDVPKYLLSSGDILFNRTNSAELVGKTAVFEGEQAAVFASYLIRFRARPGVADPRFLCYFVNSEYGRAYIEGNMTRAIGQVNISASTMAVMPIPLPPLEVQQQIVARLNEQLAAAEDARQAAAAQLAALDALPAAYLREAFGGR